MRKDTTRRERQAETINSAIREGAKQVTLRLYSSEARFWRDKLKSKVSPSPNDLPKIIRRNVQSYTFDISRLKSEI